MTQTHIDFMLSKIPLGRFGTVDEIATLICWLASGKLVHDRRGVRLLGRPVSWHPRWAGAAPCGSSCWRCWPPSSRGASPVPATGRGRDGRYNEGVPDLDGCSSSYIDCRTSSAGLLRESG